MSTDDFDFLDFVARKSGADLLLDGFGGGLANQHVVLAAHVVDDGFVEGVATGAYGFGVNDAVERNDRDFGGAATDVQHHGAAGVADRNAGADGGSDWFVNQIH